MSQAPAAPERPFVGLRPFETRESLVFFGRQRQSVELLERLHRTRFVGVIGSSGSGKSSLIYAGLIPALQAGFLVGDRDRWLVARMTPADAPWPRLAAALARALRPLGFTGDEQSLCDLGCGTGVTGLVRLAGPLLEAAGANLLLFVDQFEEIFRRDLGSHASEQHDEDADFVSVVLGLARQREIPLFVVLTMRSDHLGECDDFQGLPEALNESQYLVPRLARDEVRLAIEGPVRLFGREVAPRLLDRLLNDLAGQHDQLPVLQHALMRMWLRLVESGQPVMDLAHYEEVGTLSDALPRHADEALAGLDPARVHAAADVERALAAAEGEVATCAVLFQALTETDHARRMVRRWQSLAELQRLSGRSLADLDRLLARFRDDRRSFLRFSGPASDPGKTLVDISHESLIRQWARLRGWVEEEAHNRDTYLRIRDDAKRWHASAGGLWEGLELAQARVWWDRRKPTPAWAARYGGDLDKAESFLLEGESRRDREIQREVEHAQKEKERRELHERNARMRRTVRRTLVALAVAGALAALALYQWRRAEVASLRAESAALAARALAVLRADPEQSLRLSILAAEKAETSESADAVRDALAQSVVRKLWSLPLPGASAVAFSPDGERLAVGSAGAGGEKGGVGIWKLETRELLTWSCAHEVAALRFMPDGKGLVLGLVDGALVHWEPDLGEQGFTPLVPAGELEQLEEFDLSPDGRELAVAAGPRGLLRYELVSGQRGTRLVARQRPAGPPPGASDALASVAYSPDGKRLAMGGAGGRLVVADAASGERTCETKPLGVEILRVGFGGSGLVAASSYDHTLRTWPRDRCGGEATRYVGHRDLLMDFAFTADGSYVVSVAHDGAIRLWHPGQEGEELHTRRMPRYDFSRVATPRAAAPAARTGSRTPIATVGLEPDSESVGDTLTLWDVTPRPAFEQQKKRLDRLRAQSAATGAEDPGPALASLLPEASALRVERVDPGRLQAQLPSCR